MSTHTARAFLCYSHADAALVRAVERQLVRAGIVTWMDEFQIGLGASIIEEIAKGISSSNFLLAFLSKSALASAGVQRELDAALLQEIESKNTVILPVLVGPCEIPLLLRSKKYVDLTRQRRDGVRKIIDALRFPREKVLAALAGRWEGETGALYISTIGNLVIGKYDWGDRNSGDIVGSVEGNRVKFRWTWDYSKEHGRGVFELDDSHQNLAGGWWEGDAQIDPDLAISVLNSKQGFVPWNFKKVPMNSNVLIERLLSIGGIGLSNRADEADKLAEFIGKNLTAGRLYVCKLRQLTLDHDPAQGTGGDDSTSADGSDLIQRGISPRSISIVAAHLRGVEGGAMSGRLLSDGSESFPEETRDFFAGRSYVRYEASINKLFKFPDRVTIPSFLASLGVELPGSSSDRELGVLVRAPPEQPETTDVLPVNQVLEFPGKHARVKGIALEILQTGALVFVLDERRIIWKVTPKAADWLRQCLGLEWDDT